MIAPERMSRLYAPTLKEDPSDAEVASHRLMLRAGMMRKVAAGIYTFLPLAWRSLRKIEQIVREEMAAIGCQELLLPVVQPAELWHESGRWADYGPELARLKDRAGREFCLGPTHEEIITALVRDELRSYRDLPVSLYQINVKFRDEMRPRFGLMRGREFIMKDGYSFHADQASLQAHYDEQSRAYGRICDRLGLAWRAVEADSGQIGGKVTTEFMAIAETGEAALLFCDACDYAANQEAAHAVVPYEPKATTSQPVQRVHTPGVSAIADLAAFLGVPEQHTVKSMAARAENGALVLFCVPGDRDLNHLKAGHIVPGVRLLDEDEFEAAGVPKGFVGPAGAPEGTLVVADATLKAELAWTIGANETDYHLVDAMPGRDFAVDVWADLVDAREGDTCPECGGTLSGARGIEVSQVFQLGTKYSESMHASFADEAGEEHPFVMGCYGIGISRSLAAVIEQHHDEGGIAWPVSVAPYEVAVLPLDTEGEVFEAAADIADALAGAGIEVVIDDRAERPGVKFADADLIGWPLQVVVGRKGLAEGAIEVKDRASGERTSVPLAGAAAHVARCIEEMRAALAG